MTKENFAKLINAVKNHSEYICNFYILLIGEAI